MAVTTFKWVFNRPQDVIGPGQFWGGVFGPDPRLNNGTINVTAFGLDGLTSGPQRLQVVEITTQGGPAPNERRVNVTIKNNGARCPHITVFLTVINP